MKVSRRQFGTGAAAVIGSAALGSAPTGAEGTSVKSIDELGHLTGDGTISVGPLGDRAPGNMFTLPSGESVELATSKAYGPTSSTAVSILPTDVGFVGVQSTDHGMGLLFNAPSFEMTLDGLVSLEVGTLAQYRLDADPDPRFLTLWQGDHSDAAVWGPTTLSEAIDLMAQFKIEDRKTGVVFTPTGSPQGSVPEGVDSSILIDFHLNRFVVDVSPRSDSTAIPEWPGLKGSLGDFYRTDKSVDGVNGIYYVGKSASAAVMPTMDDEDLTDDTVDALVAEFGVTWS